MSDAIWTPDARRIAESRLSRFAGRVRREQFWEAVVDFTDVIHEPGDAPVLQQRDQLPCAVWFADTRLNFAEDQLARDDDAATLVFRNERGLRRELSLAGLRRELAR